MDLFVDEILTEGKIVRDGTYCAIRSFQHFQVEICMGDSVRWKVAGFV